EMDVHIKLRRCSRFSYGKCFAYSSFEAPRCGGTRRNLNTRQATVVNVCPGRSHPHGVSTGTGGFVDAVPGFDLAAKVGTTVNTQVFSDCNSLSLRKSTTRKASNTITADLIAVA